MEPSSQGRRANIAITSQVTASKCKSPPNSGVFRPPKGCLSGPKLAVLGPMSGCKPSELGPDALLGPTGQARRANAGVTSHPTTSKCKSRPGSGTFGPLKTSYVGLSPAPSFKEACSPEAAFFGWKALGSLVLRKVGMAQRLGHGCSPKPPVAQGLGHCIITRTSRRWTLTWGLLWGDLRTLLQPHSACRNRA